MNMRLLAVVTPQSIYQFLFEKPKRVAQEFAYLLSHQYTDPQTFTSSTSRTSLQMPGDIAQKFIRINKIIKDFTGSQDDGANKTYVYTK